MITPRPCAKCGTLFTPHRKNLSRGYDRYCSRVCAHRSQARTPPETRFWRKVQKTDPEGCWLWTGAIGGNGYGSMSMPGEATGDRGKRVTAPRFSYEFHFGPIPPGAHVLHRCDNPSCVNPAHLFLGDHAANMADMGAKGRGTAGRPSPLRGEAHPNAKLSAASAERVRELRRAGWTHAAIAAELGVSETTVGDVCAGRKWKPSCADKTD